jgi:hypothetical protein
MRLPRASGRDAGRAEKPLRDSAIPLAGRRGRGASEPTADVALPSGAQSQPAEVGPSQAARGGARHRFGPRNHHQAERALPIESRLRSSRPAPRVDDRGRRQTPKKCLPRCGAQMILSQGRLAVLNSLGAGTMRTTAGSMWGSQIGEALSAGRFGSRAKSQTPTPSKRFGGVTSSSDGANDFWVIATVIRIAAQKLPCDLRVMELIYVRIAGRRAPIGCLRHLWSHPSTLHLQHVVPAKIAVLAIAAKCSRRGASKKHHMISKSVHGPPVLRKGIGTTV